MTTTSETPATGKRLLCALLLAGLLGCGGSQDAVGTAGAAQDAGAHDLAVAGLVQWHLPKRLREISGLAMASNQQLFAVADEQAEVVELDWRNGSQVRRFAVGEPALRGDFEGIASLGPDLWLVTSDGELFQFAPGSHRSAVPYTRVATGAGRLCEVEGLTAAADQQALVLACKEARDAALRGQVTLLYWPLPGGGPAGPLQVLLQVPESALANPLGRKHFNPSGVVAVGAEYWLVAARQHAWARLAADGTVLAVARLPKDHDHQQTEGVAVTAEGMLLLADEGGKGRGRLSRYPVQPAALRALQPQPSAAAAGKGEQP